MATPAQLTANHSFTGLRNGFHSQSVLLPGDDPAEYQELLDQLTAHFDANPDDITAVRYIREMADSEWRLRRARLHHEWLLTEAIAALRDTHPSLDPVHLQIRAHEKLAAESAYFRQILRFEEKFERQYDRACRGWATYKKESDRAFYRGLDRAVKEAIAAPLPSLHPPTPPPPNQEDERKGREASPSCAIQKTNTIEPNPTPRNASCPCGSGGKFKRCCGKSAPPVLGRAA